MKEWKIIHECDEEDTGRPTLWSMEINSKDYGRFAWISLDSKKKYNIEVQIDGDFRTLKSTRSLKSAKQWVETYLS